MAITFTPTSVSSPSGVQGSYPLELVAGHEGMVADLQYCVTRSFRNQSGAALPFGSFVATDNTPVTNDVFAVELAGGVTNIQGLAISTLTFEGVSGSSTYTPSPSPLYTADGSNRMGYPDTQTVNVLSKGVVWVYSAEAVVLGDDVRFFIQDYSGSLTGAYQGRFGVSAVAANTVLVTGARWVSETTAAGLVMLEVDIPAQTYSAD